MKQTVQPCNDSRTHVACSSSCLGAYEMVLSQKGCDHKELLPPSSHLWHNPSLLAHSCPTALHPLPQLIVLHVHESGGKAPKKCGGTRNNLNLNNLEFVSNYSAAAVSTFLCPSLCLTGYTSHDSSMSCRG